MNLSSKGSIKPHPRNKDKNTTNSLKKNKPMAHKIFDQMLGCDDCCSNC